MLRRFFKTPTFRKSRFFGSGYAGLGGKPDRHDPDNNKAVTSGALIRRNHMIQSGALEIASIPTRPSATNSRMSTPTDLKRRQFLPVSPRQIDAGRVNGLGERIVKLVGY